MGKRKKVVRYEDDVFNEVGDLDDIELQESTYTTTGLDDDVDKQGLLKLQQSGFWGFLCTQQISISIQVFFLISSVVKNFIWKNVGLNLYHLFQICILKHMPFVLSPFFPFIKHLFRITLSLLAQLRTYSSESQEDFSTPQQIASYSANWSFGRVKSEMPL